MINQNERLVDVGSPSPKWHPAEHFNDQTMPHAAACCRSGVVKAIGSFLYGVEVFVQEQPVETLRQRTSDSA